LPAIRRRRAALAWKGAHVVRATLEDDDALRSAAAAADAVIHTAFNHDFSRFLESAAHDQHVIATLGSALAGSAAPAPGDVWPARAAARGRPKPTSPIPHR
jgi:nucleoside-diphosphate-sugar epimerase